jgi:hypothetical protein
MVANLITPSVTPMPVQEAPVRSELKLRLVDYSVNGASIGHGPGGTQFACTIGPLPDETVAALFRAAENHGRICLLLPEPLLLDVVATERKEARRVRIVGRVIDPFSMSDW